MAIAQIAKVIYKTKKKKKKPTKGIGSLTDLKTKTGYSLAGTGKPRRKKQNK